MSAPQPHEGDPKTASVATAKLRLFNSMDENLYKGSDYNPASFLSVAALSVRSQVNSGSVLPKWP